MKNNNGLNDYNFDIGEVIGESYELIKSFKLMFWSATLIYFIPSIAIAMLIDKFYTDNLFVGIFSSLIMSITISPLSVGASMLMLNYARGKNIILKDIFNYYNLPIMITYFLISIVYEIINIVQKNLNISPESYLSTITIVTIGLFIMYVPNLVADKGIRIVDAFKLSAKGVARHFFKFIGLEIIFILILFISILPLGIGLIWTIPMLFMAFNGVLYIKMFD
ncbi:membrane protein [sediment metagenome]|uniref:Membrane protein n=1 Tax=sediment metagenome TaxID=749907 RepID=D9PNC1_9ZZZZ